MPLLPLSFFQHQNFSEHTLEMTKTLNLQKKKKIKMERRRGLRLSSLQHDREYVGVGGSKEE